jgi:hypothetical protein
MVTEQQKPTFLLVSELRGDLLAREFGRYVRDYEVQTATSAAEAEHHAQDIRGAGGQVALLVTESAVPDADVLDALDRWRVVVPTARCLVAAHVEGFLDESEPVRRGLANGAFDAWVLMPRGARDEEFHNAVTELLSDWGSTVAVPEAEAVRIVAPESSALTESIQDFLDRMTKLDCSGLFPLLGAEPRCRWLPPQVLLDQERYVLTGRQVPREQWLDGVPPRTLATPVPGVFAVGDIRSGSMKRIATASGEGAAVVTLIHEWLATEAAGPRLHD